MDIKQLLQDIEARETRGGIALAEYYVKNLAPCIGGSGVCPSVLTGEGGESAWQKELERARTQLTFSDPEMIVSNFRKGGSGCSCGGRCGSCKAKAKNSDSVYIAEFDCVMSTPVVDLEGDIVLTKGLTFDPQMPLLWHHLLVQPVGVIDKVLHHDDESAQGRFKVIGTKMGEDVALLLEGKALRTSIGFQPKDASPRETYKKGGETKVKNWLISKAYVHENSVVSVPANQEVAIIAFSRKQLKDELVNAWAKGLYDARPVQGTGFDPDTTKEMDMPTRLIREAHEPATDVTADEAVECALRGKQLMAQDEVALKVKMYVPDLELIEGSWEYKQVHLYRTLRSHLVAQGVEHCDDHTDCHIVAMFDDEAIVMTNSYNRKKQACYKIGWSEDDDGCQWEGEPVEVEVKATVTEKLLDDLKTKFLAPFEHEEDEDLVDDDEPTLKSIDSMGTNELALALLGKLLTEDDDTPDVTLETCTKVLALAEANQPEDELMAFLSAES